MPSETSLNVLRRTGGRVVTLPAELDAGNAFVVREQLLGLLRESADPLVLDLTSARFCDCAGARAIIGTGRRARAMGTSVCVVLPPAGAVRRIATLTGLPEAVPVRASVTAALEAPHRPDAAVRAV